MAARSFPDDESKRAPATPGVVWLAHCVNLVAACTLWLFYLVPVPVVWDPITHCRVHMLRWCEWTVLSFVMTFMTEVGDRSNPWSAVRLAAMGALSTSCGFLLPLARGPREWGALMTLSCVLYVALFPRLWRRRASCVAAQKRREAARDTLHHADAVDAASRVEMSYALLTCCCIIWTTFVIIYFFASVAKWTGWDSREAPAWPFVCDVVVDLLSKLLYAAVIVDAHSALFDEDAVGARRLRELRGLVAAVWAASSDILAVSVRHRLADGRVRVDTAVSPRADALLAGQKAPCGTVPKPKWPGASDDIPATTITYEEGGPGAAVLAAAAAESSGFAGLVRRAWLVEPVSPAEKSFRMAHELERADGTKLSAEASVTRLGPDRMVVVVRDITERDAGHEAEKKLVKQAAAHERDAAANRFTRHEVKNGLLTAIGLADALQDLRAPERTGGTGDDLRAAGDGDLAASVVSDLQMALDGNAEHGALGDDGARARLRHVRRDARDRRRRRPLPRPRRPPQRGAPARRPLPPRGLARQHALPRAGPAAAALHPPQRRLQRVQVRRRRRRGDDAAAARGPRRRHRHLGGGGGRAQRRHVRAHAGGGQRARRGPRQAARVRRRRRRGARLRAGREAPRRGRVLERRRRLYHAQVRARARRRLRHFVHGRGRRLHGVVPRDGRRADAGDAALQHKQPPRRRGLTRPAGHVGRCDRRLKDAKETHRKAVYHRRRI
mmetsp:Transcript_27517/g.98207  ORF Transcript_27517/g.98207 Transcript_27517/m.98207 type:complete len:726 (+) Transcript_27517:481-2658(+)